MTEAEWLAGEDPDAMLEAVRGRATDRQLLLSGLACCRWMWLRLPVGVKAALSVLERYAEGDAKAAEVTVGVLYTAGSLGAPWQQLLRGLAFFHGTIFHPDRITAARDVIAGCLAAQHPLRPIPVSAILHDIVGNPFRLSFCPAEWRTDTAVALARTMYDTRDFSAMPILADALQDAGCDNEEALNHCRGGGVHVRGCWVVDLVLGKQ